MISEQLLLWMKWIRNLIVFVLSSERYLISGWIYSILKEKYEYIIDSSNPTHMKDQSQHEQMSEK